MINDNMSLEDLTKHFTDIMDNVDGKYTKIQYRNEERYNKRLTQEKEVFEAFWSWAEKYILRY